jgi:hypothetical protein
LRENSASNLAVAAKCSRTRSKSRWRVSTIQLKILENLFNRDKNISREQISLLLKNENFKEISEESIKHWFKNKRSRTK